jgi:hypothetical protein
MRPSRCRACGYRSHNGCCELAVDLFVQVQELRAFSAVSAVTASGPPVATLANSVALRRSHATSLHPPPPPTTTHHHPGTPLGPSSLQNRGICHSGSENRPDDDRAKAVRQTGGIQDEKGLTGIPKFPARLSSLVPALPGQAKHLLVTLFSWSQVLVLVPI